MESSHVVLQNKSKGIFIVRNEKADLHDPRINPRIKPDVEKSILIEFGFASFEQINEETKKAETHSFNFYKYKGEAPMEITWVKSKED